MDRARSPGKLECCRKLSLRAAMMVRIVRRIAGFSKALDLDFAGIRGERDDVLSWGKSWRGGHSVKMTRLTQSQPPAEKMTDGIRRKPEVE
jgi:hypothetical protein